MKNQNNQLRRLELPRRWELLEERAAKSQVDPREVVVRVDDAARRVDALLRRVRDGGGGVIEVVYGLSGSGKTTFLKTLGRFFDGIEVTSFPKEQPITALPEFVRRGHVSGSSDDRIILIDRRDNPSAADLSAVEETFAELLDVFREPGGAAVILWPITKTNSANLVAKAAWEVGRDSMADASTNGQFNFKGISADRYFELADNTSRTLTGDGLEAFGITQTSVKSILPSCDTISDFYNKLTEIADRQRDETWSVLKEKPQLHLWVVLPGDDATALNATADALTQGTQSKIDIDKIGELIDRPDQNAIYVSDWKNRRGQLAHLLRAIDVRLFSLPPHVSLAAVRSCGETALTEKLRQPATNLEQSKKAMRSSRLYKAILKQAGIDTEPFAGARKKIQSTTDEYLRIQSVAAKNDKPLNKALGELIRICLQDDAPHLLVTNEKKSINSSSLQPDIHIALNYSEFICLEPTWRTSGVGLDGEIDKAQNTTTEAHMKKYVLEKATQYIKGLELLPE